MSRQQSCGLKDSGYMVVKTLLAPYNKHSKPTLQESQILLGEVLQRSVTWLRTWPDTIIEPEQERRFHELCQRRQLGEPLAYILEQWSFWSFNLMVNKATLIPRPETECLVEYVLNHFSEKPHRVLELGTGSGAIVLALAKERPNWLIDATDINQLALTVAQKNAENLSVNQIKWYCGDWFLPLPNGSSYHLIISNPPYLSSDDPHLFEPELRFEPEMALVSEQGGLAALKHIITESPNYLLPDGCLLVEHGYNQGAAVRNIFKACGYYNICTICDLNGIERMTMGCILKQSQTAIS